MQHRYKALPAGKWTRLLSLQTGTGDLCGCLVDHDLETYQEYQALSYVWGDAKPADTLICEGRSIPLGQNLGLALRVLRNEACLVWVDQVCINQQDEIERSQQVSLMGTIYSRAQSVFIWLGEDPLNEAPIAFGLIQQTTRASTDLLAVHGQADLIPRSAIDERLCLDRELWLTVERLMSSPWFTRVWVLQEVGLARKATLACGKARMNFCELVEMTLFVALRTDLGPVVGNVRSGVIWDAFEGIWSSFGNEHSWRNDYPLSKALNRTIDLYYNFVDILNHSRLYGATDHRDRIYAFLGHPKSKASHTTTPDYRLSVEDIYLDTASRIMQSEKHGWTILSSVDHVSISNNRSSWVPRWNEDWRVYWLGYAQNWYRAGGKDPAGFVRSISIDRAAQELQVRCFIVDTIEHTSRAFRIDTADKVTQQFFPTSDMFTLMQHDGSCPYGELREQAYSLVLVAGRAADEMPAEDDAAQHLSVYHAWRSMRLTTPVTSERRSDLSFEISTFESNVRRALTNRRIFKTGKGFYGAGHRETKPGDICVVIPGANVPFVLRQCCEASRKPIQRTFQLIGECYLQGIMRGEIFEPREGSGLQDIEQIETTLV